MDLNKVMLIGRLTKNPELRATTNGQNVTSFSIATNRVFKDAQGQKQERAEFHNIVAWGKLAEICSQYLSKGRRAYIEGRLQTRDWVTNEGVRRYSTEVIAENMIILDSNDRQGGGGSQFQRPPQDDNSPTGQQQEGGGEQEETTIEEIPF